MYVISLSNMMATTTGLAGPQSTWLTWATLEEATEAAVKLNAQYGLNAYILPADRTDRCLAMVDTHSFGYAN